jgi:hypothetical protein
MKVTEEIAAILDIDSGELESESLKAYLKRKIRALEADRFQIASKYANRGEIGGHHTYLSLPLFFLRGF